MNEKNLLGMDSCFMDLDNPIELFNIWMEEAKKSEINDPNALSLATANANNEPSVRMILLKAVNNNGFVFYTNLNSPKSDDLKKKFKSCDVFSLEKFTKASKNLRQHKTDFG